jgi:CRP-like cAMP-binding protein
MSTHFKPRFAYSSQKLYNEGDVIDDFYFSTKGVCAFVSEK